MLRPLSSLAWLDAIANRQASPSDWLTHCTHRIDALDPVLNAYTLRTDSRAQRQAQVMASVQSQGTPIPELAGLPYAVKNLFDIQGEITLAGSKVLRNAPAATEDAVLITRLESAGAVLTGALNMDEFAYGFTTENTHYGPTRNPHDTSRIAGGSSGGSAAAVAAGMVPVALGSDTNGSIRVPSSLCGVWGMKPTFGRLPRRGSYPFVHNLDHVGPIADSAQLLARVYDVLQGPDPLDPACFATSIQPVSQALHKGISDLRIGILGGYFEQFSLKPGLEAVRIVSNALGGAHPTVEWPFAEQARAAAFILTASEGASLHMEDLRRRASELEPVSVDRFIAGALHPSHWYTRAARFRQIYRDAVNALFSQWDVLLAPATPCAATTIGQPWLILNGSQLPTRAAMGVLTQPISYAGCPVVVAPTWPQSAAGLPVGVQLIAAPWREDLALRVATWLEQQYLDIGMRPVTL